MFKLFSRSFHQSCWLGKYSNLKLTLFSKDNCGLCITAKTVMTQILKKPDYKELQFEIKDINDSKNSEWWDAYCFDVPVLHVENLTTKESLKIFHRLDEYQVTETIKKASKQK